VGNGDEPACLGWTDHPVLALTPRTVSQQQVMQFLKKCEPVPVS
jgi:hypothetical protein